MSELDKTIDQPPGPQANSLTASRREHAATIASAAADTAPGSAAATIDIAPCDPAEDSLAGHPAAALLLDQTIATDLPVEAAADEGATIEIGTGPKRADATLLSIGVSGRSPSQAPGMPRVEGYQILKELGRGGMGVVYKARQGKLNRIVALKMVLAGAHAGQDQLARFYTEAEAVAHLQQPNIVQIYEVSEHEGLPYFSLEYVDGGSLSERIGGKPQPVEDAARQVALLSRAMDYAHKQGIIHRDLKPANVLITRDGQPKITDFGLAKRLESDASQTRSGTLMGTPNYMAPEQARGEVREVGPLADVYALGVILYEMLVGRTPFLGASILDTLQQVRSQEPVPPSRLQPKVPRDLETICLKCLEKEPAKRYETAGAMADDLERFLAGEPILARPVGAPERLWRWCRRNRRVAALSAAVLLLMLSLAIGGPVAAILVNQQRAIASQQREIALQNESLAKIAQATAEENEQKEKAARAEADQNAKAAAEQRGLALEALGTLVSKVQNQLRDTPATQRLKQDLLGTGLDGLRKVAKSAKSSRAADAMMAEAHQRMGDVFQSVGQHQEAREEYAQSHAIRQQLVSFQAREPEAQRNLALSFSKLGDITYLEGDREQAMQHYREALRLREALAAADAMSEAARVDLATSYVSLGKLTEPAEARSLYAKALKIRESLAAAAPYSSRASRERDVWIIYNKLAELSVKLKDLAAATEYYGRAVTKAEAVAELVPKSTRARTDVAVAHVNAGNARLLLGETDAAKAEFGEALKLLQPLANDDPKNLELQTNLVLTLARHGDHAQAAEKAEQLRGLAPQNRLNLYNVACVYSLCSAAAAIQAVGEVIPTGADLVQGYQDKAIATLHEAAARGLKGSAGIAGDRDLDAIRSHAEYSTLLAELDKS
jgi:serine/threonine-protein kinase